MLRWPTQAGNTLKGASCRPRSSAAGTLALRWPRSLAGVQPSGAVARSASARFVQFVEHPGPEVRVPLRCGLALSERLRAGEAPFARAAGRIVEPGTPRLGRGLVGMGGGKGLETRSGVSKRLHAGGGTGRVQNLLSSPGRESAQRHCRPPHVRPTHLTGATWVPEADSVAASPGPGEVRCP